jgi:hypothetical protein
MFNNGDPVNDNEAREIWQDAHPECIECGEVGCIASECPQPGNCDHRLLETVMGEQMHPGKCRREFEAAIANKEAA